MQTHPPATKVREGVQFKFVLLACLCFALGFGALLVKNDVLRIAASLHAPTPAAETVAAAPQPAPEAPIAPPAPRRPLQSSSSFTVVDPGKPGR